MVHLGMIWIILLESVYFFHDKWWGGHINITFQCALTFAIERKIMLMNPNACSKLPIIIKFHNSQAGEIREAMGEIASYHKKD
jgi:hypothetical protein